MTEVATAVARRAAAVGRDGYRLPNRCGLRLVLFLIRQFVYRLFLPRPGAVFLTRPYLPTSTPAGAGRGSWLVAVLIAVLLLGGAGARAQETVAPTTPQEESAEALKPPAKPATDPDTNPDSDNGETADNGAADDGATDEGATDDGAAPAESPPSQSAAPPESAPKDSADRAQAEAGPPAVSPIYSQLEGRIEVVGPDTYLLLDKEGNPQKVLNIKYEDFLRLMQLEEGLSQAGKSTRPQYTHERLEVKGVLKPDYAEFTATMEITLHTSEPVEVPLRFGASILRRLPEPPPRADGRFLNFVPEKGYVATLQGQPGEKVSIALDFITPLERNGDRSTLRLLTPRASVGELTLDSPAIIDGLPTTSEREVVETTPLGDGGEEGTRIFVRGLGGEFRMSWEQQQEVATESASVLSSVGRLRYAIDEGNVRTEATLEVSSLGAAFDTFRVQLPPGAEYIRHEDRTGEGEANAGRLIKSVERETPTGGEGDGKGTVYVVSLNAETRGPVRLHLATNHQLERRGEKGQTQLHGFEVLGAVRQEGEIGLAVDDQLQLSFNADNLQQVATDSMAGEELTAALRYSSQPWRLGIEVAKRERRVNATSSYKMTIDEEKILLDMTVEYTITGPGKGNWPISFPLNFDLQGWKLTGEPVTTLGLEDAAEAVPAESQSDPEGANILRYPYASAINGRPKMVLHLEREMTDDATFEFELPFVADAFAMGTSSLEVTVAPGLLFTPNTEKMAGLSRQPIDDSTSLTSGVAPGQQFEYRGFLPEPVFAGSLRTRPQRMTSRIETEIQVVDQRAQVTQRIDLDVRHQPLEELALVVPSEVLTRDDLEVSWLRPEQPGPTGGAAISEEVFLDLPMAEEGASTAVPELRFPLVRSQLGKLQVIVRYSLDAPAATSEATWMVPIVTPLEAEILSQRVDLQAGDDQVFSPVGGSRWRGANGDEVPDGVTRFTTSDPLNFLPLARRRLPRAAGVTTIEQIWMQTWLTEGVAQQRFAAKFHSSEPEVVIELPDGVNPQDVEVMLDGSQVFDATPSAAQLVVPLSGTRETKDRTIEIRYREPYRFQWVEPLRVEVPRLASGIEGLARMYWQLITPTRHLALQSPEGGVDAYTCRWSEGDWRAEGDQSTQELELWIGALPRERPTLAEHTLLWRGDPRRSAFEVWLVRRELIVLACSAAVLGATLALVYVPLLRSRGVWLTLVVAVAALGLMYPGAARLMAQAGLLGGLAGMVAVSLAALSRSRQPETPSSTTTAGSTIVPSSRGSSVAPLAPGNLSTNAPTVSIELSDARS